MKKVFLITSFLITIGFYARAQEQKKDKPTYKTAIGIRLNPFGISFKANMPNTVRSIEINGYFKDGFIGAFLYEWCFVLNHPQNLRAYVGGGGNVGFKNEKSGGGAVLGAGAVVGIDYKFLHLPLNLSLDWQPSFQFGKTNDFNGLGGIAARFTF